MTNALAFHPENIPVADFPFPVGSAVRGSLGSLYAVADRGGFAFVACCLTHERAGSASGWHPQRNAGRMLGEWEAIPGPAPEDCGRDWEPVPLTDSDVGTTLACGCEVIRGNLACDYHAERYGPAQPDCGDCRFGVPVVYHE